VVALEVSCLVIVGGRSDCEAIVSLILLLRFAKLPPIDFLVLPI
jgi:hypothetical protein